MIRSANRDDFEAISRLYAQLNVDDPPVTGPDHVRVFEQILDREGLDILLLELDGEILGATYLNLILPEGVSQPARQVAAGAGAPRCA